MGIAKQSVRHLRGRRASWMVGMAVLSIAIAVLAGNVRLKSECSAEEIQKHADTQAGQGSAANGPDSVNPKASDSSEPSAIRHASGYRGITLAPALDPANDTGKWSAKDLAFPNAFNALGLTSLVSSISAKRPIPANMAYVRISRSLLERELPKQIQQQGKIADNILGADVNGTCQTTSRPELVLVPNAEHGCLEIRLTGAVKFQTTSFYGPLQFSSRGTTEFQSVKPLYFDGRRIRLEPARTTGTTRMTTAPVSANMGVGRGLAMRIGARSVQANHAEIEAITNEHTEQRISRELDAAVEADLRSVNEVMAQQIEALTDNRQLGVHGVHSSTTPDILQIVLLGSGAQQAIDPPQVQSDRPEMEIHVHSSLVLKTLTDTGFRETLESGKAQFARLVGKNLGRIDPPAGNSRPFTVRSSGGGSWLTVLWNTPGKTDQRGEPQPNAETGAPAATDR